MRIIYRGSTTSPPIKATCDKCHTIFEFHRIEAKHELDYRDGDAYVIDCPVCKVQMWVRV